MIQLSTSLVIILLSLLTAILGNNIGTGPSAGTGRSKVCTNWITGKRFELIIRNAQKHDIPEIASLCAESFDGPFEWHEIIKRQQTVKNYADQFNERYTRFVAAGYKHAMIVACEPSENEGSGVTTSVIGFIEVGQLPSPINSADGLEREDKPYFGNVAVSPSVRRQGIGQRLIKIAMKLVQDKWKDDVIYVAVDGDNTPALDMYAKNGFSVVLDESQLMNRSRRSARLFLEKVLVGQQRTC